MLLYWLLKILFHNPVDFLIVLVVLIFPLLISITVHEWSHGIVAYKFGDPTPKMQGRLTFNPFAHLDPIGTLMLFIVGIGWAKPVQINPENIDSKWKQMLVALAGPASNFIFAVILSFILYGIVSYTNYAYVVDHVTPKAGFEGLILTMLGFLIKINIILGLFNLLPLPPLDGSNIIKWVLPEKLARAYFSLAPFGLIILIILLFTVGFNFIFDAATVVQRYMYNFIEGFFNNLKT